MGETKNRVIVEYTAQQATEVAFNLFRAIVCEAIGKRGKAHVALSGGTTPRSLYQELGDQGAATDVPWQDVQVFFGDERDVPHDNIESNYRMAQRMMLDNLPINPEHIFPMPADRKDLATGAEEYERTIRQHVPSGPGGLPRFDMILLGVGADGHTASLFPDSPGMKEKKKLVVTHFVPVLGRNRMTFTLPLINAAANIIMLVTGDDKAQVMRDILERQGQTGRLPAAAIEPADGLLYFVLDSAAAKYAEHYARF